jgi:hypothetical protein
MNSVSADVVVSTSNLRPTNLRTTIDSPLSGHRDSMIMRVYDFHCSEENV